MQRSNAKLFASSLFAAVLLSTAFGRCLRADFHSGNPRSSHLYARVLDDCKGSLGSGGSTGVQAPDLTAASPAQMAQMTGLVLKSGITPEATKGSWSCGSSSGDGKGCFLRSAKYVVNVARACAPCVLNFVGKDSDADGRNDITIDVPIHGEEITVAKGDASKCPACVTATTKSPKCGGTVFGIGSKKSARSCKLVDEAGCWPDSSRRVLHDCGAGKECAYKVTDAKAKIWCCRPKETAFFKKWRNLFRCGSMAYSKSKDRDGAVILFE